MRRLALALIRAFRPAEGTTEGAVMLGLILLAGGWLIRGNPDLSLLVPGGLLVLIGTLPVLRRKT